MPDATTKEATGLLRRLRLLAESAGEARPPSLLRLTSDPFGFAQGRLHCVAYNALLHSGYYATEFDEPPDRAAWMAAIDRAITTLEADNA